MRGLIFRILTSILQFICKHKQELMMRHKHTLVTFCPDCGKTLDVEVEDEMIDQFEDELNKEDIQ